MKATHVEHVQTVGYQQVHLKPGELVFGRKMAATETGLSEQKIRTALTTLKSTITVTVKPTNKYSIIQVQNWELYQDSNQHTNHQDNQQLTSNQPATNQQLTTDKNIKNDKKNIYGEFNNILLSDEEHQKLQDKFNSTYSEKIENLSAYLESKGKKYKSHYATILSWDRKEVKDGNLRTGNKPKPGGPGYHYGHPPEPEPEP
jgi:hypothetical protein|tara:strand:+ start:10737 stop:11342 length:606 start_codon:yes stop_codon:yes gene_type:complete